MSTKKQYFPVTAGQCTYELTAVETACTKPEQAQARQNPIMEKGDGQQAPPLAMELLTAGSFWNEGQFPSSFFSFRETAHFIVSGVSIYRF